MRIGVRVHSHLTHKHTHARTYARAIKFMNIFFVGLVSVDVHKGGCTTPDKNYTSYNEIGMP